MEPVPDLRGLGGRLKLAAMSPVYRNSLELITELAVTTMEKDTLLSIGLCFAFCLAVGLVVGSLGLGIALGAGMAAGIAWEEHLQSRRIIEPAE